MKTIQQLGVYIHFPYCPTICNYCNFNKYKSNESIDLGRFTRAIVKELETELSAYSHPTVKSVYFGGGTPSLLAPIFVKEMIAKLEPAQSTEITLEANPNPRLLTRNRLLDLKSAGINRISLGVQSLCDKDLKFFNRDHSVADARKSIATILSVFDNLSLDIIWGRPSQKLQDWRIELEEIKQLGAHHLSLYQLTIERGTKLFKDVKSNLITTIPSQDEMADFFEEIRMTMPPRYKQYEISSFSMSKSFESIHNKGYWSGSDYIGVGPGAHGKVLQNQRTIRIPSPSLWQNQVEELGHGIKTRYVQSQKDIEKELIVTSLRRVEGISTRHFHLVTGSSLDSVLDLESVLNLANLGFLDVTQSGEKILNIKATFKGLAVVDKVLTQILKL